MGFVNESLALVVHCDYPPAGIFYYLSRRDIVSSISEENRTSEIESM
jgi:hypothetical protein